MDIIQELLIYINQMKRMLNVHFESKEYVLNIFSHLEDTIKQIHHLPYDTVEETINILLSKVSEYSRPMPGMETEYGQYRRLLKAVAREAAGRMAQLTTEELQSRMKPNEYEEQYEDNPGSILPPGISEKQIQTGIEVYHKFHDFAPTKIEEVTIPHPKVLIRVGDWTAGGYFSPKWKFKRKLKQTYQGKKGQQFIHEFKDKQKSTFAFAPDKGNSEYGLAIAWRRCRLTKHGLEDI